MTSRAPATLQLHARVSVHGEPVGEASTPAGRALVVGPGGALDVPAPSGAPYVAEASWVGPREVVVADGQSRLHRLGPDDTLEIVLGPVRVEVELVEHFALRRTAPFLLSASLPWAVTVVALSLLTAQADVVGRNLCPWFGIACPAGSGADASFVNAEYVARLLREDHAGEVDGVVEQDTPRAPVVISRDEYVPAGQLEGDLTELGGGAEAADETVRSAEVAEELPRQREDAPIELLPAPVETEAPAEPEVTSEAAPQPTPGQDEGVAEGGEQEADAATEAEQGWGLQDWIDASPEQREIQLGLQTARHRLAIDPNDPDALSMLAYFQYLGDDLAGAEATYDKLLALHPEDAAAWNNKALVLKRRGDYAREELLYRTALALDPGDTTAMNNLAVNLAHQRRFEEALGIMRQLEVLLPGDAYSDLHRAKIHAEMGHVDEALKYLERALRGSAQLDLLHHTEFRQDIRVDPSFEKLRDDARFHAILRRYYGEDAPR